MPTQMAQHASNITATLYSAAPSAPANQTLFTVEQFSKAQPAFTVSALRNLIFKAETRQSTKGEIPGNGLIECGAIIRIGRKILIDEQLFFGWVRQQNVSA